MSNELEKYIRDNLNALDRKQPDPAVLGRVLEEMKAKTSHRSPDIVIPVRLMKWAAACLLVTSCGVAVWYFSRQEPTAGVVATNVPEKRPLPAPKAEPVERTPVEEKGKPVAMTTKTTVRTIKKKKTVVLAGLNNMESAATRINAVASASKMKYRSDEVADALVHVLNNDPNTNVRLAALDGLTRFRKEAYVRQKLVASLKKQQDPLVQIDIIDLLTGMRELNILSQLEKMVNDENTHSAVKDIAWSGIQQLRHP